MKMRPSPHNDNNITPPIIEEKSNEVFIQITYMTGKIYTNQTDRFLITSNCGYKYLMVAYNYDSNTIHAECLKSGKCGELLEAYRKIHILLVSRGLKPKLHFLDNECAESFKNIMHMNNERFQLVSSNIHRKNAADQTIQTFKSHFITGLMSINKLSPYIFGVEWYPIVSSH